MFVSSIHDEPDTGDLAGLRSGVAELDDLAAVLAMACKVDLAGLPAEELADATIDLFTLRNRLDAMCVNALTAVEQSQPSAGARRHSITTFLTRNTGMSSTAANRWKRASQRLGEITATAKSFTAGRISLDHVLRMVEVWNHQECRWAFKDAEQADLIPAAETMDWRGFTACCRKFVEVADPSQGEDRNRRQKAKSRVHVSPTFDGMHRIDGWLDPVAGEIFLNELTRLETALFKTDWGDARQRVGREPLSHELGRTTAQRNAAALAVMAQRSASLAEKPLTNLPCINVHLDWDTYQAVCHEMAGLDALYPTDGQRETETGHSLSPQQIADLLIQGHIRRVVVGPDGHILDFGRKT